VGIEKKWEGGIEKKWEVGMRKSESQRKEVGSGKAEGRGQRVMIADFGLRI